VSEVLAAFFDASALPSDVAAFVALCAAAFFEARAFVSLVLAAAALAPAAPAWAISFVQLGPVFFEPSARVTVTS
ncbi:hypothetical protein, partial [Leclercia adecarboxylata]|uniref:hypothetical protein n=1 Tax=Leclercia adecarboxylata TaxID=83655 RepID=UPI003016EADF